MINNTKYFRIHDIIIHHDNFLKFTRDSNSVDLIITSPPYNIGINYEAYNDNQFYKDYMDFSRSWLTKCFSILKKDGRICINVPLDTKSQAISADLTVLAKKTGFKYKGTIIWNKQIVKNKYSLVFSKNIEVILVFYKDKWVPIKKEYKEWVNNIWTFSGESAKRVGHPAPFPVELPRRLIKMFSETGNIVLDPFSGSGTTLVACDQLGRKGIGVEISEEYFNLAKNRIIEKKW